MIFFKEKVLEEGTCRYMGGLVYITNLSPFKAGKYYPYKLVRRFFKSYFKIEDKIIFSDCFEEYFERE